jgi:hypothetical protein
VAGRQGFVPVPGERSGRDVPEFCRAANDRADGEGSWLGGRDSNPDNVVQSHVSYR